MNKELEEAILIVNEIITTENFSDYDFLGRKITRHLMIFYKEIKAIETVLKELKRLQEDYIAKDKIREILNKLKISDIEPWSTYKVDGEILFDLEELLDN